MGRRGRPPKVQVGVRKPVSPSGSSRELSSSPERFLFHDVADATGSQQGSKVIPSSSSRPAVGLSWVSVLKASVKDPGAAGPLSSQATPPVLGQQVSPISIAALSSGNPPSSSSKIAKFGHIVSDCRMGKPRPVKPNLEVDENGFRKVKKSFQKRVVTDNHSGPSAHSLIPEGESLFEVVVPDSYVGMDNRDLNLAVLDHEGDSRNPSLPCPPAPVSNSFAILRHLPSTLDSNMEINAALGAHPIHGDD
ncbi:unnamed protein product [Amaranthus hypochondriacus]